MNSQIRPHSPGGSRLALWAVLAAAVLWPAGASAQYMDPGRLDNLVSRIALYPDPLLAQVLTASTYYDQIPDAAAWADQHSYLQGDQLAQAIEADNLPWDPSVLALLPFPSVLDNMERDMNWTQALGDAVLNARPDVMDAVQRMRRRAYDYGNLRDCPQFHVVIGGPVIEIMPIGVGAIYVPVYDPYWIYARPRAGFSIGISFGPRVFIGASFGAIGWRAPGFDWRSHAVMIDHHPWQRTVQNRTSYVHQYSAPIARPAPNAPREYRETHEMRPNRSDRVQQRAPAQRAPEQRDNRREERRDERH